MIIAGNKVVAQMIVSFFIVRLFYFKRIIVTSLCLVYSILSPKLEIRAGALNFALFNRRVPRRRLCEGERRNYSPNSNKKGIVIVVGMQCLPASFIFVAVFLITRIHSCSQPYPIPLIIFSLLIPQTESTSNVTTTFPSISDSLAF